MKNPKGSANKRKVSETAAQIIERQRGEIQHLDEMISLIISEGRKLHFRLEAVQLELVEARENLAAWKAISGVLLNVQDKGKRTNFTN